jgi:hypothetical protein
MTSSPAYPPPRRAVASAPSWASQGAPAGSVVAPSQALATMLTGHVLRDGEAVLLVIKPSLCFVPFHATRFLIVAAALLAASWVWRYHLGYHNVVVFRETVLLLVAARLMWAVLHWMGRLYVLTDQRIIRLAGVFHVDIFDCPLRKVARTQLTASFKERMCRVATLEFYPSDEARAAGAWQIVARPAEVHEQVLAAINRARSSG